ncbi:DUF3991 and toprim domain-containing protein [Christensenellaceae bacterium OttesenSCG-928-K19]|nr:DUF3991 and toprim domain-containing protein [Christensenellaceae bacterium OttesenSCG-928-K19]
MRFTEEQLNQAASVNIVEYCAAKGIPLRRFSGETYCHADYDSLKITGNKWIRHSGKDNGRGFTKGTAIHFAQEYGELNFREAVTSLLEFKGIKVEKPSVREKLEKYAQKVKEADSAKEIQVSEKAIPLPEATDISPKEELPPVSSRPIIVPVPQEQDTDQEATPEINLSGSKNKIFVPPEKNKTTKHAFMYLTETRGIDKDIVNHMIHKKLLYEDTRKNCVFPGYDKKGTMRYAALKGTNPEKPFTGEPTGSKKVWGWSYTPAKECNQLRVFESAIDALSFMTLEKQKGAKWDECHYLALGGVAKPAIFTYIRNNKEVSHVQLCFDNDPTGQDNANKIAKELLDSKKAETVEILMPEAKDFNDDVKKNETKGGSI